MGFVLFSASTARRTRALTAAAAPSWGRALCHMPSPALATGHCVLSSPFKGQEQGGRRLGLCTSLRDLRAEPGDPLRLGEPTVPQGPELSTLPAAADNGAQPPRGRDSGQLIQHPGAPEGSVYRAAQARPGSQQLLGTEATRAAWSLPSGPPVSAGMPRM